MQLSEDEIDLVRGSFWELSRRSTNTATMFYDRLFEIAPRTRAMFPEDLEQQGIKLMSMLGLIVGQLHDHATLVPMVGDLARRHVGYGAEAGDYAQVGAALLWTLERGLAERYTPPVAIAWGKAYAALCAVMIDAAYAPPAGA